MNNAQITAKKLIEIAQKDKNTYFVGLDAVEAIWMGELRKHVEPKRIIRCGISEQNAVGVAAGLAMQGKNVYLIAPAYFITSRAYEQIKLDLAYHNANVKLLAMSAGIWGDPTGGFSHWAYDCITLLKDLPNIRLVNVATTNEYEYYLDDSVNYKGFMCIMEESPYKELTMSYQISENKLSRIAKGKDFTIIATGNALSYALELKETFYEKKGLKASVYSAHSLVPFDRKGLQEIINRGTPIISIDEHGIGGLTAIISQTIAEYGKKVKYQPIYIHNDRFNIVGHYEHISRILLKRDNVYNQIKSIMPKKIRLISTRIKKSQISKRKIYLLFECIPLLKLKQAIHTKDKSKTKVYLFGFIRIF